MKEFDVKITEILERTVTVAAENLQEAEEQAELEWHQGKHVLSAEDFTSSNFTGVKEATRTIEGLLIEPLQPPTKVEINHDLESLQDVVGGYIECINPFNDPVTIICNEEGKLLGLQENRAIYNQQGDLADIVRGSFLVVGDGIEDFESLSKELMDKYEKHFAKPEKFYCMAGQIIVQKLKGNEEKNTSKQTMNQER